MKGLQQFIGIFFLNYFCQRDEFNSVILFYIKFGTKYATWEHDHKYEVATY